MRPQVSVYMGVSIDQRIATPDGGLGWLTAFHVEGEDFGYAAFMQTVDLLILGRTTHDTVLGFDPWPYADKRLVVMSHRPIRAPHGETRAEGALAPLLDRLGAEGARHVYLDGGALVRQGLAEGVVDHLTLTVVPALLGEGIPLFGGPVAPATWRLDGVTPYGSGIVQLRYSRG